MLDWVDIHCTISSFSRTINPLFLIYAQFCYTNPRCYKEGYFNSVASKLVKDSSIIYYLTLFTHLSIIQKLLSPKPLLSGSGSKYSDSKNISRDQNSCSWCLAINTKTLCVSAYWFYVFQLLKSRCYNKVI